MKLLPTHSIFLIILITGMAHAEWPMSNDPAFDTTVPKPAYPESQGPRILLDGGHHNFFIQWDIIKPFAYLAEADGYRPVIDDEIFTPEYLEKFDIVMIITALPFDFTTKTEVTTEISLPQYGRNSWVANELPVFTGFGDCSVLLLL
jgi:hypothetical protein